MLSRTDQVSFLKTTHCHATHAVTWCVYLEHLPACYPVMFFLSALCKHVRVYVFSLHTQLKSRLGSHGYWLWWKADSGRVPLRYMNMMLCKHEHEWAIDFIRRSSSFPAFSTLTLLHLSTFSCHCVSSSVCLHMHVHVWNRKQQKIYDVINMMCWWQ